jgi:ADA HAT complex component 1
MVKLVCIDCHRENFSSTQGFINHCRIAHRRDFKSHEEAAVASGQSIEVDEVGGIIGEEKTPAAVNGLVHPLIRSAPTDREAYLAVLSRIQESVQLYQQGRLPGITSIPTSANSTPTRNNSSKLPAVSSSNFVPSSSTPYLSKLMHTKGFSGNLDDIVSEAKRQVDFDDLTSEDGDSEDTENRPTDDHRRVGGLDGNDSPPAMRIPTRAGVSPAPLGRPTSSKGMDGRIGRQSGLSSISPRLSHATPAINTNATSSHIRPSTRLIHQVDHIDDTQGADVDMEMIDGPSIIDLSPHTVASNNAPSLVSDDGEYDEGDDAESATSEDDEDSVAEIDIEDDGVDKVEPRAVLRNRTGSEGMRLRKEDKHVTFVSQAVKESGKERRTRRT